MMTFNNQNETRVQWVIANFKPKMSRELWRQVGDFTRSAVTDFRPNHGTEADLTMSAVARLTAWSVETAALDLDRTSVFNGHNIEQYIATGCKHLSKYAAGTLRLSLMRVAEELGVVERGRVAPRRNPRPSPRAPYSASELAGFRAMSATRSNELQRRNWSAFVTLAAGCGLSAFEILHARVDDIRSHSGGLTVSVNNREVTCAASFEDDLRHLVEAATGDEYFWQSSSGWRPDNRIGISYPGLEIGRYARTEKAPTAGRLRATWIVGQLNKGVHLTTLTAAMGITSLRPLEAYLPFLTPQDPANAAAALRSEVAA